MNPGSETGSYRGYHSWRAAASMKSQMHVQIFFGLAAAQLTAIVLINYVFYSKEWLFAWDGFMSSVPGNSKLFNLILRYVYRLLLSHPFTWVSSFGVWLLYPVLLNFFKRKSKRQAAPVYLRGSRLVDAGELQKETKKEKSGIWLGGFWIPHSAETRHFFVIGRPGTGKTVAIASAIEAIAGRGSKALIYDFKGDLVSKFYDPKMDLIFNPLDKRGIRWNIFNDIRTRTDIEAIANSLIPAAKLNEEFWNDAARDVLIGIINFLYRNGQKDMTALWQSVTAPGPDISNWIASIPEGLRGHRYVEDASSKQALGVFSVMMQFCKAFEYLQGDGDGFSINNWLEDPKRRFIFLSNYPDIKDTARPVLTLFIDYLGKKILSLPDDYNRRIYFFLDEVGTLNRMPTIVDLLTLSRSKGGSVWLGTQDIGQLDHRYTRDVRQSIINACGNKLMFGTGDDETAEVLSRVAGRIEELITDESFNIGTDGRRDGFSVRRHERVRDIVMASEFQNLRELECYLKLVNCDLCKIQLKYRPYSSRYPSIVLRDDINLEKTASEEAEMASKINEALKIEIPREWRDTSKRSQYSGSN